MSVCQKFLFVFLFIAAIFLFLPGKVFAAVTINEFSSAAGVSSDPDWPDWVEVYYNDVDITLYQLIDAIGNIKNLADAICTGSFCTIDWSNKLNNPSDTIKLVLIAAPDSPVDQITYGETGDVLAPTSGQSAGRSVDGTGGWVIFSTPTKGSTNNTSTPVPSPSPSPTPTLTLTPTPKPPTPTPTFGSTNTPTPTSKPSTLTPTKKPTPTLSPTSTPTGETLGEEATSSPAMDLSPTSTPTAPISQGNLRNLLPKIFIGAGILLLLGSAVPFVLPKLKKGGILKKDEEID